MAARTTVASGGRFRRRCAKPPSGSVTCQSRLPRVRAERRMRQRARGRGHGCPLRQVRTVRRDHRRRGTRGARLRTAKRATPSGRGRVRHARCGVGSPKRTRDTAVDGTSAAFCARTKPVRTGRVLRAARLGVEGQPTWDLRRLESQRVMLPVARHFALVIAVQRGGGRQVRLSPRTLLLADSRPGSTTFVVTLLDDSAGGAAGLAR